MKLEEISLNDKDPRVFISHTGSDIEFVRRLAAALSSFSISAYFDEIEQLVPGESWIDKIASEIEKCDAVLFIISESWRSSNWIRNEVAIALAEKSQQRTKKMIPVLLSLEDDIPHLLRGITYADFRH
ncbi:MAG TPA: toll/interleukin-1 receptor domain-containing protein, partial [Xanthobacteraceae bacterium]|nr:toll/interleukin-1 receptor domain-containing protein [Xanthobacteraceae bacterium]